MKRFILSTIIGSTMIAASLAFAADDAAAKTDKKGRINNRKEKQQERIGEGVKDGTLTAKEAAKIEAKEAKLNKQIRKDRKDGGGMTEKERIKAEVKQDKMSKEIYKEKHDKQKQ